MNAQSDTDFLTSPLPIGARLNGGYEGSLEQFRDWLRSDCDTPKRLNEMSQARAR